MQVGETPPPLKNGIVERISGDHEVQRFLQPGQGGIDDGAVLVGPPAAHQAHHGLGGADVEGRPAALAFGFGQAAAVVDRESPHHCRQLGEGRRHLIAYRPCRAHRDHTPLAAAGKAPEEP
ncbi:hypothetical protein ACWDBW_26680 [Streptomyces sp. NPDC001107]